MPMLVNEFNQWPSVLFQDGLFFLVIFMFVLLFITFNDDYWS